jgi:hypothetical protein
MYSTIRAVPSAIAHEIMRVWTVPKLDQLAAGEQAGVVGPLDKDPRPGRSMMSPQERVKAHSDLHVILSMVVLSSGSS